MPPTLAAQVLLAPDADAARAERALQAFAALGFATGPVVGGSFSIEADRQVFADVFGVRVQARADGGVTLRGVPPAPPAGELPRAALPASLQSLVAHVLFTEPPAFGPGGGFAGPA